MKFDDININKKVVDTKVSAKEVRFLKFINSMAGYKNQKTKLFGGKNNQTLVAREFHEKHIATLESLIHRGFVKRTGAFVILQARVYDWIITIKPCSENDKRIAARKAAEEKSKKS